MNLGRQKIPKWIAGTICLCLYIAFGYFASVFPWYRLSTSPEMVAATRALLLSTALAFYIVLRKIGLNLSLKGSFLGRELYFLIVLIAASAILSLFSDNTEDPYPNDLVYFNKYVYFFELAVSAVIIEELFFRQILYKELLAIGFGFRWVAILSSVAYAFYHLFIWIVDPNFVCFTLNQVLYTFVLGLIFVAGRRRTDSILVPIALHSLNNVYYILRNLV